MAVIQAMGIQQKTASVKAKCLLEKTASVKAKCLLEKTQINWTIAQMHL